MRPRIASRLHIAMIFYRMLSLLSTLLSILLGKFNLWLRARKLQIDFHPKAQHASIPSLLNITFSEVAEGLEKRNFTSVDLVKAYLQRIKEVNHEFRSVIEVNPEALEIAKQLDQERKALRPLHGVPILIKDNVVTLNSMNTTCGSYALVGAKPSKESVVVTALRRAGVIILGKTNMAEWSGFRSTSGCSGWSARGGQTRGIFCPNMKASGSSSGSAIATALGLGFAALGTETCYSVVSPAERSGVVGFKPTRELIPTEGIIYASQRQDSIGLLTRTVRDAAHVLGEIIHQSKNKICREGKGHLRHDLLSSCSTLSLRGIRIGIPSGLSELQNIYPAKQTAFRNALTLFKNTGAEIVAPINIPGALEYAALSPASKRIVLDTDMKIAINTYLASLKTNPQDIKNLQDLIDFTKGHHKEDYPARNVAVFERAQATNTEDALCKEMLAKEEYFTGEGGIADALEKHKLDVLVVPTLSVTLQTLAAKAGSPVLSLSMGCYPADTEIELDPGNGLVNVAPGIPFSLYISGGKDRDADVLKVAHVFEKLSRVREILKPYLVPTTELADVRR